VLGQVARTRTDPKKGPARETQQAGPCALGSATKVADA
jgi:hypothetical protein